MKIHVTENGTDTTVTAEPGMTMMEALRNANIKGIVAECGGSLACASCHVYVSEGWLDKAGEIADMENDMLDCTSSARQDDRRLSCQINLTDALDGIKVNIPESQI